MIILKLTVLQINIKNCSLSTVLTSTDQKSLKRWYYPPSHRLIKDLRVTGVHPVSLTQLSTHLRQLLLQCANSIASFQVNPMSFKSLRIMSCQFSGAFLFLLLRFQYKAWFGILQSSVYGRPHIGANGVSGPLENGWKIKKRKHAKRAVFYDYVIFWEQSGQACV